MKITKVKIENFKSFKNLDLQGLLEVNTIFGYNNSGKSNFFKFLELVFSTSITREHVLTKPDGTPEYRTVFQNFWEKSIINQPYIFRIEGGKRHNVKFSVSISVSKADLKDIIQNQDELFSKYFTKDEAEVTINGSIESAGFFNGQQKLSSVKIGSQSIFDSATGKEFEGAKKLNHNDFMGLMSFFNDCVELLDNDRYFVNEREDNQVLSMTPKNYKNYIFNSSLSPISSKRISEVEKFIKNFTPDSTDSVFKNTEKSSPFKEFKFSYARHNGNIELMLTNSFGSFPISSFGTGVQQIIYILSRIVSAGRTKIFLIEEIEMNLSPKYLNELISYIYTELIQKKSEFISQLFYTTHSPLTCYRTEFRILQSRIDASGVTTIFKITPNTSDVEKLKAAMKILINYHPNSESKPKAVTTPKSVKKKVAKKASPKKKKAVRKK